MSYGAFFFTSRPVCGAHCLYLSLVLGPILPWRSQVFMYSNATVLKTRIDEFLCGVWTPWWTHSCSATWSSILPTPRHTSQATPPPPSLLSEPRVSTRGCGRLPQRLHHCLFADTKYFLNIIAGLQLCHSPLSPLSNTYCYQKVVSHLHNTVCVLSTSSSTSTRLFERRLAAPQHTGVAAAARQQAGQRHAPSKTC